MAFISIQKLEKILLQTLEKLELIIVIHRRKEDLIMEKIKIVAKELKAELKEDFVREVKSIETNLKAEVVKEAKTIKNNLIAEVAKINSAEDLTELIRNREEKLKADILEEVKNVQKSVKAEILKVKTPAAEFIPECPICLHQMAPPTKIVHCVHGHKLCETCSKKDSVKSCPTCKTGFMGRDFGMEAFVRELAGEK